MMTKKYLYIFIAAFILLILLVACSKAATPTETQSSANTQPPVGSVQSSPEPTKPSKTVPEDVPIMPDSYELAIANQLNLEYKVKAQIKDIVAWYQTELPKVGWDLAGNPDSVVGSMATMARSKANGDRINLAFQYNMIGEFTIVTVYLTRAP
jgi:hypothetical protein